MDKDGIGVYQGIFFFASLVFFGLLGLDWCTLFRPVETGIAPVDLLISKWLAFLNEKPSNSAPFRLLFMAALGGSVILKPYLGKNGFSLPALCAAPVCSALFYIGYTGFFWWDGFGYPLAGLSLFVLYPFAFSYFSREDDDKKPLGINDEGDDVFSISLDTEDGAKLVIKNPRQGIGIEGGAGSGKSASIIVPAIFQFVRKGYAGFVYDYEGDLTEGGGLLTKAVFKAMGENKTPVSFAFINFSDLTRTVRCNPISPRYVKNQIQANEIAQSILFNLNREWATKRDFWASNAMVTFAYAIWYFAKHHPKYCTIPHVVEFLCQDFENALGVMSKDRDISTSLSAVIEPFRKGATNQAAGVHSSLTIELAKLREKSIYYVLSPDMRSEFDLDITSPDNPVMLCVGNSPALSQSYAGALGCIAQVCRINMNRLGRWPKSVFMMDEFPTLYVHDVHKLPAEARKKGVCTVLAYQTVKQVQDGYGKDKGDITLDNLGNMFVGASSVDSAKRVSELFGEYQRTDLSFSYNEQNVSHSTRRQFDKVMRINEIAGQKTGHFVGKIMGADEPFFSVQLKYRDYGADRMEIPPFNEDMTDDKGSILSSEQIDTKIEANMERIAAEVSYLVQAELQTDQKENTNGRKESLRLDRNQPE